MALGRNSIVVSFLCLVTLATSKPIMVSFGTNQGPIVPRQPKSATVQQRTTVPAPAPVSENREDVPNPNQYKPLIPHQYRSKIYSFRPPTNLILGTALDQKFTPTLQKHNLKKKENAKELGIGVHYTGPHIFEKQDYEIFEAKKQLLQQQLYQKPHYIKQLEKENPQGGATKHTNAPKYVPQIGVIYISGVRYYIPQIAYFTQPEVQNETPVETNSVYDNHDVKYSH